MLHIPATGRVEALREMYYSGPVFTEELSYVRIRRQNLTYMRAYLTNTQPTTALRAAYAEAEVLQTMQPVIEENELIVGKSDFCALTEAEQREYNILREKMKAAPKKPGIGGHMVLDYPKLLRIGVEGLLNEIRSYRNALDIDTNPETDLARDEFYEACEVELTALLALAQHYAEHARTLADSEVNPIRKAELLEIAEILDHVPAKSARTFHEALQSIHFYQFTLWDGFHYGRVDQYLLPFYENDLRSGRLTRERAQELIDCFRLIAVGYMHPDTSVNVMIGGRDPEGNLVENELTELFLQSVENIRTMHKVEFAISQDTGEELLRYAAELFSKGFTMPSLFNDDVITEGMRMAGYSVEEARNWANTGCVEITPIAKSGIWVVSPYHNMPKLLLEAMKAEPASIDALLSEFSRILRREVVEANRVQNRYQLERSRNGKEVMRVSCLVDDCLARGRSIDDGGARYNHIQPNFLGLANVIDSLIVLDRLVYSSGEYSMARLCEILASDFSNDPELLHRIVSELPHYGTDDSLADHYAVTVTELIKEACRGLKTFRGGELQPGVFSYLEHARYGLATSATPDGRRAGYPLSSGSSPVQGRETLGPTASILSVTSWDHRPFLGGVAINMKFSPCMLTKEAQDRMLAMIRVFLLRGGFQLQINPVSTETLKKARENPERYRDLIVRVGGFSANFVKLTPEMQQELIDRSEHAM